MVFEGSLGPRPVCAIRVTRGGLEPSREPSPRRTFPTSLTGDLKSEIAEDVWERGCFEGTMGVYKPICRFNRTIAR